jgi:hypothetical protein
MRHHLALLACAAALTGCSFSVGGADAVEAAELEKQVAGLYTPDDPDAEVTADCKGDLDAEVDATQDCHLEVGEETADVRVVVTSVDGDEVDFEATPFLPAERVAETIQQSLEDQGFPVDSLECEDELMGEEDATVTCTVAPADGEGRIEATVTSVDGLLVNFNYEVVA